MSQNRRGKPDATGAAELAARQWGVLDACELRALGFSRDAVMRRCRAGILHPVHPGVFAYGHAGLTLPGRFLAAVKACGPDAALSHRSAGVLWHLLEWDEAWLPEVTIPMRGARSVPGVIVHRTRVPFETVVLDGIRVTIPARTAVDLAQVLPFGALRRVVREGLAHDRLALRDLVPIRGRRGNAKLAAIVADGYVPTRSELEDALLELVRDGGLPEPIVNRRGVEHSEPDFLWPAQRLVVEADGAKWHSSRLAREDDAAKQARLEAAGYRVLRVTWKQTVGEPLQTLTRLRLALAV